MKLIDADKLNKSFDDEHFTDWCENMNVPLDDKSQLDGFHIGLAQGQVFVQPIAYDVDKVIEQLVKRSSKYYDCMDESGEGIDIVDLEIALDIVRKGGVE